MRQSVSGILTGRPRSLRSAEAPLRSWRLPDLFFLPGFSDGRDRLESRRPPPAGVRAPHRAIAPCSAREAVALRGPPPLFRVSHRGIAPVHSVAPPHPRRIAPHCPPPEGAGGGAKRRAVGVSVEGWPCVTPPCEERGAAARRDEHFRPDDDRRVPSRSWSSEVPYRKRRTGRRHDRREASADRRECGLPVEGLKPEFSSRLPDRFRCHDLFWQRIR